MKELGSFTPACYFAIDDQRRGQGGGSAYVPDSLPDGLDLLADDMTAYMRSLPKEYPSPEEEIALGKRISLRRKMLIELAESSGNEVLREIAGRWPTKDDEEALAALTLNDKQRQILSDGMNAIVELYLRNRRLVIPILMQYKRKGEFLDLAQEGELGLMHAAARFKVEQGARFSTYATWRIRQAISRAAHNMNQLLHLPAGVADEVARVQSMRFRWKDQHGGIEPTPAEISLALAMDEQTVKECLTYADRRTLLLSLDYVNASERKDREDSLSEVIEDPTAEAELQAVLSRLAVHTVLGLLADVLTPREQQILDLRIMGENELTLRQIGKLLGISRGRVRQIEESTLKKLREKGEEWLLRQLDQ